MRRFAAAGKAWASASLPVDRPLLVFTRRIGEKIVIGHDTADTLLDASGNQVGNFIAVKRAGNAAHALTSQGRLLPSGDALL
jgi:hypothetical protein